MIVFQMLIWHKTGSKNPILSDNLVLGGIKNN